MTHERSEVALEMRAHGALDDAEARMLESHLRTCAQCRELEREIVAIDMAMRSHARELAELPVLTKVRRRVFDRVALRRYALVVIVVSFITAMTSVGVYLSDLITHGESTFDVLADLRKQLPVMYTVAFIMLLQWWEDRRKALRAATTKEELFAFYRKQLDREIRSERHLAFICLFLGSLFFMGFLDLDAESLRRFIMPTVALVCFVGVFLHSMCVEVPRMQREREELG